MQLLDLSCHLSMYVPHSRFLINFVSVCMLLLGNFFATRTCMCRLVVFFMPHMQICITLWSFYCLVHVLASLVVVTTLLGGAEPTRVSWDSASVMCLGIFDEVAHQ